MFVLQDRRVNHARYDIHLVCDVQDIGSSAYQRQQLAANYQSTNRAGHHSHLPAGRDEGGGVVGDGVHANPDDGSAGGGGAAAADGGGVARHRQVAARGGKRNHKEGDSQQLGCEKRITNKVALWI